MVFRYSKSVLGVDLASLKSQVAAVGVAVAWQAALIEKIEDLCLWLHLS